ncbi:LOG family protein [Candidatus Peregrinibacteria bacterium]|nr:LOG family protein [Candidatus Peregrinibacteria bacterium]
MKSSKLKKITEDHHFRVAIFGSARMKKNDPRYKDVYNLAKMIAAKGMDVVTGGGPGIMEAANKGHKAGRTGNGVHSMGLTIKLPKEQITNKHLDIKKEFHRFSNRLDEFLFLSNVVVVAPGGVGTLLEFIYSWQLVQVNHICHIPIILVGYMWHDFLEWMKKWPMKRGFLDLKEMDCLYSVDTVKEAMDIINKAHHKFMRGKGEQCVNYLKYKIED